MHLCRVLGEDDKVEARVSKLRTVDEVRDTLTVSDDIIVALADWHAVVDDLQNMATQMSKRNRGRRTGIREG